MRRLGGRSVVVVVSAAVGIAAVVATAGPSAADATASASAGPCLGSVQSLLGKPPTAKAKPLTFGIYPAGDAGRTLPLPGSPRPQTPAKAVAALRELAGSKQLVVHGPYVGYADPVSRASGGPGFPTLDYFTRFGFPQELIASDNTSNVSQLVGFVRALVDRYADNPLVTSLMVMNEPNGSWYDGQDPGIENALIAGVEAAKSEARKDHDPGLQVGFNVSDVVVPGAMDPFFTYLASHGGPRFVHALGWVGVDIYPGTWSPPLTAPDGVPGDAAGFMAESLSQFRDCLLPKAGIPRSIPLRVEESGWATDPPVRSYAEQADVLKQIVTTVNAYRGVDNIASFDWFNLRDTQTANPDFEYQWGLMTDTYQPKPAYFTYRRLIAELGATASPR